MFKWYYKGKDKYPNGQVYNTAHPRRVVLGPVPETVWLVLAHDLTAPELLCPQALTGYQHRCSLQTRDYLTSD